METNYKIIGGDGREYGPVTLDELKGWVRDGRVGRETQIWRSDLTNWLAATQYQELQSEIAMLKPSISSAGGDFDPVGFWPRVAAYILDQLILGVIGYLILGAPPNITTLSDILNVMGARLAYSFLISAIYYVGMNGQWGATAGKMAIGARIVRADDGSKIGFGIALVRFLATIVSSLTFGIGYLMVAFRDDKRALHDLIANTRVIYKR